MLQTESWGFYVASNLTSMNVHVEEQFGQVNAVELQLLPPNPNRIQFFPSQSFG